MRKWGTFAVVIGTLLVIAGIANGLFMDRWGVMLEMIAASVGCFFFCTLCNWMEDVRENLDAIRDKQERAYNAENRYAAERVSAPVSESPTASAVVDAFVRDKPQTSPGSFDAEHVANVYRRSQRSRE